MPYENEDEDKPCRACSDFKSWAKKQGKKPRPAHKTPVSHDCPLDKEELGRSAWGLLHSITAYYPESPTKKQQSDITTFFQVFAKFYPCEPCALDFQKDIKANPPKMRSQRDLMIWLCERHNTVNVKLNKPTFDCSKVFERWKDGWKDGSCD